MRQNIIETQIEATPESLAHGPFLSNLNILLISQGKEIAYMSSLESLTHEDKVFLADGSFPTISKLTPREWIKWEE